MLNVEKSLYTEYRYAECCGSHVTTELYCTLKIGLILFLEKEQKMKIERWMQRRDRQRQVSPENEKEDGFVQELENNKVF
jgi:hypothetical protein